jgi:hypothetical protein
MELAQLEPLLRPLGETRRRLDLYRTLTAAMVHAYIDHFGLQGVNIDE